MDGSSRDREITADELAASIARVVARSPDIDRPVQVTAEPLPPTDAHIRPLHGARPIPWTLLREPTFRCRFVARRRAPDDDALELLTRLRRCVQRALDEGRLHAQCEAGYVAGGKVVRQGDPRFDDCEFALSLELAA